MVNDKKQIVSQSDVPLRRRGRPAGSNRVPLSREERRARNALYERERRDETAALFSELIEAANCDPNITQAELLATVICRLERATKSQDIAELERVNANLEIQIASAQARLGLDDADLDLLDTENTGKKRKRSRQTSSECRNVEKRAKTQSETSSGDSGIEVQREQTVSPPSMEPEPTTPQIDNEEQTLDFLTEADIALLSDWVSAEFPSPHQ